MITLSFPDANDIVFLATLDGVQHKIRLLWNDAGGFWTIALRTAEGDSLVEGIKVVPDYPLLAPYHKSGVPQGEIMVVMLKDNLMTVGRADFAGGKAVLAYLTEAEVDAI